MSVQSDIAVPDGPADVAPPSAPPATRPAWQLPQKGLLEVVAIGFCAICAALLVLYIWELPPFAGGVEVTEDAYVRGHTTVIAPQVSGYVVAIPVDDFQRVRMGQVLVRIDDVIYRAQVDQAKANLGVAIAGVANANAALVKAQADMKRISVLAREGASPQQLLDQTVAALRQAEAAASTDAHAPGSALAQVEAAKAALRLAQINLDHTVIRAPDWGQLSEVGVRVGQYVTNGSELLDLVPDKRWVIAEYKEAQTAHMRVGQPASFTVDGLAGARFTGRVEQIAPASGQEFAVLKPDNATGNFVKVPQRIGVRIAIDPGQRLEERLLPGMSVDARIDTSRD
jgi:RND family efflux transporter MFP subunit